MFKLSMLISKPVYSLYEGLFLGYIYNVCFDKQNKKIAGFVVLSSDEEQKNFVSIKNILKCDCDAVITKNINCLSFENFEECKLINKTIFSIDGENLGEICELFFDENYVITSVETNKKFVCDYKCIVSCGQDAVFFHNEKIKISNYKPKSVFDKNLPNISVGILSDIQTTQRSGSKLQFIGAADNNIKTYSLPKKIAQNPNFLIGRVATNSIKGDDGDWIVKEGQRITERSISKAQLSNKIYELSTCAN